MGKFLNKFKEGLNEVDNLANKKLNEKKNKHYNKKIIGNVSKEDDDFNDDYGEDYNPNNYDDEVGVQRSQKPESFHHFILENEYRDLEMSIRGFKDVYQQETKQWVTKRKIIHCFTDDEAEDILRTAQSHLATDIKLGYINSEAFPILMDALYKEIAFLFESIAEYRYGRFGSFENQYKMKLQNNKIFLELFTRVQANYSRSIQGQENKQTHESVKGQESLQQIDRGEEKYRRYT